MKKSTFIKTLDINSHDLKEFNKEFLIQFMLDNLKTGLAPLLCVMLKLNNDSYEYFMYKLDSDCLGDREYLSDLYHILRIKIFSLDWHKRISIREIELRYTIFVLS